MTQEQFQDLLKKYRQGRCTLQEKKIIDDWFSAIITDKTPFSDREEEDLLKNRSWAGVDDYISKSGEKEIPANKNITFTRWPFISMAASVILLLMIIFYLQTRVSLNPVITDGHFESQPGLKHFTNEGSEPSHFFLPDGSEINLLPQSNISFLESFNAPKREIYLEGEAFFEVAPDENRPFLVYTNDLTTEVLGTSFLIKAYKKQKEIVVTVKTGKVSVYTNATDEKGLKKPQQEVILSPNQQVIYNADEQLTLKKLVNEPQVILPQPTLKDSYTNAPVIEILKSLEENYGIAIQYDAAVLSNCTFTSDMSEEGFYEQINIICNALGAEYKVSDTVVIIEATGCNAY